MLACVTQANMYALLLFVYLFVHVLLLFVYLFVHVLLLFVYLFVHVLLLFVVRCHMSGSCVLSQYPVSKPISLHGNHRLHLPASGRRDEAGRPPGHPGQVLHAQH